MVIGKTSGGTTFLLLLIVLVIIGCHDKTPNAPDIQDTLVSPLIVVGGATHDFGRQKQNDELTHTFVLRNQSSSDLAVVGIKTSCGCMVPDLNQQGTEIKAHSEVTLPMTLQTGGKKDHTTVRAILAYRKVTGLTPATPSETLHELAVTLETTICPDFRLSHEVLNFGAGDLHTSKVVTMTPDADLDARVLSVQPSAKWIHAEVAESGQQVIVSIDTSHSILSRSQELNGALYLETSSANVPRQMVRVFATYQPHAEATPSAIVVSSDTKGDIKRTVSLQTLGGSQITANKSSVESIVVAHSELGKGRHLLTVTVPDSDKAMAGRIDVSFQLGESEAEAVWSIPVHRFYQPM